MSARIRPLLALLLAAGVAACGPGIDAVVADGSVTVAAPDVPVAVETGPISFVRRARLTAGPEGARIRVDCDGSISAIAASDGAPGARLGAGIVEFELAAGARVGRRDAVAFDLLEGSARVRTGTFAGRLIVMNGRVHLSAEASDNRDGIDVLLTSRGDQMRAEVTRGTVLLNATDEEERDTVFVTLHPGDTAVAKMGEEPRRGTTHWFEGE